MNDPVRHRSPKRHKRQSATMLLVFRLVLWPVLGISEPGCSGSSGSSRGAVTLPGDVDDHDLVGEARWYGERHHGRTTASGERFDMNDFTAAHPSLPFGTIVRVIREDTRQFVVVRINDRGPDGRRTLIDLSRASAEEIDLIRPGHARVMLEILDWPR